MTPNGGNCRVVAPNVKFFTRYAKMKERERVGLICAVSSGGIHGGEKDEAPILMDTKPPIRRDFRIHPRQSQAPRKA